MFACAPPLYRDSHLTVVLTAACESCRRSESVHCMSALPRSRHALLALGVIAAGGLFALRLFTHAPSLPVNDEEAFTCPTSKSFRPMGEVNPRTGAGYPVVLLFSFEGSGNTWVRTLFENATGTFFVAFQRYSDSSRV